MFRKLKPVEKKLSKTFGLSPQGSQRSKKSNQSEPAAPQETQRMIPQGRPSGESSIFAAQAASIEEVTERQQEPGSTRSFKSELTYGIADPLAARYQHALLNENIQSQSGVPESIPIEKPQKTPGDGSTSSPSDSEFDWNETDESELDEAERMERQQRKLRQVKGHQENERLMLQARRLRKVYLFLMKLSRPVRVTLVGFLGSGIAITPAIIVFLKFTSLSAKNHVLAWSIWFSISFAAHCLTCIAVDNLPPVVIKLFNFFYGSTPEKLKTQVELWINVRFWTKVSLGLTWSWVILSIMFSRAFIFNQDPGLSYFQWVLKVAAAFFAVGIVLLLEKILLQLIKINFHKTSLKDRIAENEKALWALDQLAAAKGISHSPKKRNSNFFSHLTQNRKSSDMKNPPDRYSRIRTPGLRESTIVDVPQTPKTLNEDVPAQRDKTSKKLSESSPSQKMDKVGSVTEKKKRRRSSNLLMVTDQLTSAIANAALKDGNREASNGLFSTHSAKKLAKKLFEGLDEDRGGVITRNEFEPYFKTASDAALAFQLFDKDGNGDIDRKEMRNAVTRIYRERKALATGLKDMSSAVAKLDAVLMAIAGVITIFIWFFIFNPKETSAQLVPMATIILGFSFIFGNAAKNLFESMLFIFSIHPYDVGDMVMIDDSHMFVLEFGLFSTTFQRVDGQVVVAPNSILSSKKHIVNIRRSGPMWEITEVMVSFETPLEVLHEFRTRLRQYVLDNPREWKGGLDVHIDFISNQNLIQLIVAMEHKTNWQDWGARLNRRTFLMREMKTIMDGLNMIYKLPVQPVSFVPGGPKFRDSNRSKGDDGLTRSASQRHEPNCGASSSSRGMYSSSNNSGRYPNISRMSSLKLQAGSFRLARHDSRY